MNDYGYEPTPFALSLLIRAYVNAGTLDSLTQAVELYKLPNKYAVRVLFCLSS